MLRQPAPGQSDNEELRLRLDSRSRQGVQGTRTTETLANGVWFTSNVQKPTCLRQSWQHVPSTWQAAPAHLGESPRPQGPPHVASAQTLLAPLHFPPS